MYSVYGETPTPDAGKPADAVPRRARRSVYPQQKLAGGLPPCNDACRRARTETCEGCVCRGEFHGVDLVGAARPARDPFARLPVADDQAW